VYALRRIKNFIYRVTVLIIWLTILHFVMFVVCFFFLLLMNNWLGNGDLDIISFLMDNKKD
jgi:hypothetical protein